MLQLSPDFSVYFIHFFPLLCSELPKSVASNYLGEHFVTIKNAMEYLSKNYVSPLEVSNFSKVGQVTLGIFSLKTKMRLIKTTPRGGYHFERVKAAQVRSLSYFCSSILILRTCIFSLFFNPSTGNSAIWQSAILRIMIYFDDMNAMIFCLQVFEPLFSLYKKN